MEMSLPGLVGALIGTVVAWANYLVIIGFVTRRLQALDTSRTVQERGDFLRKLSIMRQLILGIDIIVFAAIGFWLGATYGG
ncbi:MAG: hypothetical protein HY056_07460 [Proteobacteria bacterium]|nr:hypothetical protein [Pseudomonadota bacterium]